MKKILFAASETVPFIKTGGLADVVGSLPKYFDKEKYDVRVMVPKYLCIRQELRDKMSFVDKFYVKMNWRTQYVGIDEMEYDGVKYYFLDFLLDFFILLASSYSSHSPLYLTTQNNLLY